MSHMNYEWISEKGAGLTAFAVGLVLLVISYFESQYRYVFLVGGIIALYFGYKQLRKRDTPFQKRERELRRKRL